MTEREAFELQPGDEVFWEDPDCGLCSRYYTILSIEFKGDVILIEDWFGDKIECFAHELR